MGPRGRGQPVEGQGAHCAVLSEGLPDNHKS
jgi:hypothetical protein